jgi:hypothetical protein
MALLVAKFLLAPLCVVAVSLAGRRWGVAVAGILGGLPMVAGPILLALTLIHGRAFGADAAASTLLGLVALTAFVVVYGRVAPGGTPMATVFCGWAAFLIAVALLSPVHPPAGVSFVLAGAGFALGLQLLPPPREALAPLDEPPWWDLPGRALAALTLVVALTAVSGVLGPHLSGLLAPFPIITSVLAVFTHAHGGPMQARILLRNFLVGFYGFASFCLVLAISLPSMLTGASFALALAAALVVSGAAFAARRRWGGVESGQHSPGTEPARGAP